eukprot:m.131929 g.131929  ORF g.131929 m.131929 type:complete len:1485 (+) comp29576_c0_seq2:313-4767(+)
MEFTLGTPPARKRQAGVPSDSSDVPEIQVFAADEDETELPPPSPTRYIREHVNNSPDSLDTSLASEGDPGRSLSEEPTSARKIRLPTNRDAEEPDVSATLIPIRSAPDGGGIEVLIAQNPIINWPQSKGANDLVIRRWPGEYRFLGSKRRSDIDATPFDTAVRQLFSGWPSMMGNIPANARSGMPDSNTGLFVICNLDRNRVYNFVMVLEGLSKDDSLADKLNETAQTQLKAVEAYGDEFFSLPLSAKQALCPKLREHKWRRVDELLLQLQPQRMFVNDWQQETFERFNVAQREPAKQTLWVLERLVQFSNVVDVLEHTRRFDHDMRTLLFNNTRLTPAPEHERGAANGATSSSGGDDGPTKIGDDHRVLTSALDDDQTKPQDRYDSNVAMSDIELLGLPDSNEIVVLSYNINVLPMGAMWFATGQGTFKEERIRRFLADLRAQSEHDRPHVLVLQELFATPFIPYGCLQRQFITEMKKLNYFTVTSGRLQLTQLLHGKWTDSGLVIFSKLPVEETHVLTFADGEGLDNSASKGALHARLRLAEGKFVDIFNCHLQAIHTGQGSSSESFETVQRLQMVELRKFIMQRSGNHAYILTGDFNVDAIAETRDPLGSYGYAFPPPRGDLSKKKDLAIESGVEAPEYRAMMRILDPYDELEDLLLGSIGDRGPPIVHPTTRPPRRRLPNVAGYATKHKHPQRLDYIFFRPALSSLLEHVESSLKMFDVHDHPRIQHLSDHYAILSRFRIKCGFGWRKHLIELPSDDIVDAREHSLARLLSMGRIHRGLETALRWSGAYANNPTCRLQKISPTLGPLEVFFEAVRHHSFNHCLGTRAISENGTLGDYEWLSYDQVHRRVRLLASGLSHKFSLTQGTRVGLLSDTCAEWVLSELALMHCGCHTICLLDLNAAIEQTNNGPLSIDLLICSVEWVEHALDAGVSINCPIVTLGPIAARLRVRAAAVKHWDVVDLNYCIELGDLKGVVPLHPVAAWATFTSMTRWSTGVQHEGLSSAVQITWQQMAQKAVVMAKKLTLVPTDTHYSYQTPAFIGERLLLHAALASGASIGFFSGVRSAPKIFNDIQMLRPTFFTGTQNFFNRPMERVQDAIDGRIGWFSSLCFEAQAKLLDETSPWMTQYPRLFGWISSLLDIPTRPVRLEVIGDCRPRFVLILCSSSMAAVQPNFTRWLRTFLGGCDIFKSLVSTEACGFVTFGKARCKGGFTDAFYVGEKLDCVELSCRPNNAVVAGCAPTGTLGQFTVRGPSVSIPGGINSLRFQAQRSVFTNEDFSKLRTPSSSPPVSRTTSFVKSNGVFSGIRLGLVGSLSQDEVYVFGNVSSMARFSDGEHVVLGAAEQLCMQCAGRWLAQIFLTVRDDSIVAVASVDVEQLWRLTVRLRFFEGSSTMDVNEMVDDPGVVKWCLDDLNKLGLFSMMKTKRQICGVRLVAIPFCYENKLQTPSFTLIRAAIEARFNDDITKVIAAAKSRSHNDVDCDLK